MRKMIIFAHNSQRLLYLQLGKVENNKLQPKAGRPNESMKQNDKSVCQSIISFTFPTLIKSMCVRFKAQFHLNHGLFEFLLGDAHPERFSKKFQNSFSSISTISHSSLLFSSAIKPWIFNQPWNWTFMLLKKNWNSRSLVGFSERSMLCSSMSASQTSH